MDLRSDPRQPVKGMVGSLESWHLRGIDRATDDQDAFVAPARRPYSYWAECECPHDCPRDHDNE